jgi:hypothetical protein
LKKLFIILWLLLFSTGAFAIGNIYVDGIGAFTQTNDAKNEFGGGGALLYQVTDDFNLFVKCIVNQRKITQTDIWGQNYYDKYKYFMGTAGIEYLYNIKNLPLFWKSAFGIGTGKLDTKTDYIEKSDNGLCVAVWTGAMYMFTQSISAYMDIGFHKTYFFNELKDAKIMGFQVLAGVRFTAWGVNKSIFSEY